MARGYNATGDFVLADGTNIQVVWDEFLQTLTLNENNKDSLKALLTYSTTNAADRVVQVGSRADFETASEYGEPVGVRVAPAYLDLGFNFVWRDLAARYTWQFLRQATREQVEAVHRSALEADNHQLFTSIMGALFNNVARTNAEGKPIQPLYNGDSVVPPEYAGVVHTSPHTHYLASGAATVDGVDLRDLMRHVLHHGYGDRPDSGQMLIFANPQEMDVIRSFKAGQGTPASPYDFIPSQGAPAFLSAEQIIGQLAPAGFGSIRVDGSFGPAWVSEQSLIPAGYMVGVVSQGANSSFNPVGLREHLQAGLRGLQLINPRGQTVDYPLIDSYYSRGFGTGVRHRGAAAVMQITAGAYAVPSAYSTVLA